MNKIKEIRVKNNLTAQDVANMLKMSQSNYTKIENGQQKLTLETADKITKIFNVDISDLISSSEDVQIPNIMRTKRQNDDFAEIEILSATASCGNGIECMMNEVTGKHLISMNAFREITYGKPENIKILPIRGDSMQPTINNNDYVWVDMSVKSPTGDGLYLLCIRSELFVKRIRFDFIHNRATILSDNSMYPPLETDDPDGIKVLGKIICINKVLS